MHHEKDLLELAGQFNRFMKRSAQEWRDLNQRDITITQFQMLHHLRMKGEAKSTELAELLGVTPGAITGIADKLVLKGYLHRMRDGIDRRVVMLALTEEGRRVLACVQSKMNETIASLFQQLPDEDLEHLRRIFAKLAK